MRQPDRTAPRYRYDFSNPLDFDFLKKFREKYPQYNQYPNDVLLNFIKKHNIAIRDKVVNSRDGIELQGGIGRLFIGMVPPRKRVPIAYAESLKLGVKVYYRNPKTDGKIAKVYYSSFGTKYKLENRQLWYFTAARSFTAEVAKNCEKNYLMYCQMDNYKYIWEALGKKNYAESATRATNKKLETYNEFDLE